MQFQILDKNGNPIYICELDKEAAKEWGKEDDNEYYAYPGKNFADNWFDKIGWAIANTEHYNNWSALRRRMLSWELYWNIEDFNTDLNESRIKAITRLQPFFNLIYVWEKKGYTPKRIK